MNPLKIKTTHIIMVSFLVVILLGTCLLALPVTHKPGYNVSFIDALFTATTSTCVTGLITVNVAETFNTFGHIIILIMIQIGGWGVLTFLFNVAIAFHKKLRLSNQILLQDALNLNSAEAISEFIRRMMKWTLIVEVAGAACYTLVFIPEYGWRGIWYSVFHAVSAFCNAGIDILGPNSFCNYATNPIINLTTCSLVILSGLGYIVWFDVATNIKQIKSKRFRFRNLSLHSKLTLCTTLTLLTGGTLLFMIYEYNNPNTLAQLSFWNKLQVSLFQSMTCRTAGFVTIPQENLSNPSALVSIILMFIGGSPVGTAGGVKTVTIVVIFSAALAALRNQKHTELFNRRISTAAIQKAISVVCISGTVVLISTMLLSTCCNAPFLDVVYETVSACATVGITRGVTAQLNTIGKLIIIGTMFLGRVGPISLALAFSVDKRNRDVITSPVEEICIG